MKPDPKRQFLQAKGYDLRGKDSKAIDMLYAMYRPTKPNHPQPWTMWAGTNRPHHKGA